MVTQRECSLRAASLTLEDFTHDSYPGGLACTCSAAQWQVRVGIVWSFKDPADSVIHAAAACQRCCPRRQPERAWFCLKIVTLRAGARRYVCVTRGRWLHRCGMIRRAATAPHLLSSDLEHQRQRLCSARLQKLIDSGRPTLRFVEISNFFVGFFPHWYLVERDYNLAYLLCVHNARVTSQKQIGSPALA